MPRLRLKFFSSCKQYHKDLWEDKHSEKAHLSTCTKTLIPYRGDLDFFPDKRVPVPDRGSTWAPVVSASTRTRSILLSSLPPSPEWKTVLKGEKKKASPTNVCREIFPPGNRFLHKIRTSITIAVSERNVFICLQQRSRYYLSQFTFILQTSVI